MVEGILEGLKWLGLEWDEGPYYQSERLNDHQHSAAHLLESGSAYALFLREYRGGGRGGMGS